MAFKEEDSTWLLALESALLDGCESSELIEITRGRVLPEEHRAHIWYICLGGGSKISNFAQFDEIFDLPDQALIRKDCKKLVEKLGNDEEEQVSIVCDMESIFTHYCKSRHLKYNSDDGWDDIIAPLLAVKMPREHVYICFEEIIEKYIPRSTSKDSAVSHLFRLLLLYHEPQICTFLDSKKISTDCFAGPWLHSIYSSVCSLDAIYPLWDIYFQERDPFFILFLALVIIVNARDQILSLVKESAPEIIAVIKNVPSALSTEDVFDFCSLARYYSMKTPNTFRKEYSSLLFGSVYPINGKDMNEVCDLPLSQALCLPVSPEEIFETQIVNDLDIEQVRFFLVDCRPPEQYNSGHLHNAFHLDSNLMLEHPVSFQTAVQGLFLAQRHSLSSPNEGGSHLAFIGSGREEEDQYLHMVVASFLQRDTQYVSLVKGGYQAFHNLLSQSLSESLSDHNLLLCLACNPNNSHDHSRESGDNEEIISNKKKNLSEKGLMNRFSSVFKSKSLDLKERIYEYVTNPNDEHSERHVNHSDKGKLYRSKGDVFSMDIHEEDERMAGHASDQDDADQLELVDISKWLKKPDVIGAFSCQHVRENGYVFPGFLLLTETLLFVICSSNAQADKGRVTGRRSLSSIVKITSKKKYPDLITFKYGTTKEDGDVVVQDFDRFLISKASEVTRVIKEQIMKLMDSDKS